MKVRIKSHSVRFRIDAAELNALNETGVVRELTHIPTASGETRVFATEIRRGDLGEESELRVEPYEMSLLLSSVDCANLASNDTDGIYLRREWMNEAGQSIRFVTYIELDKKKRKHRVDEANARKPEARL